MYYFFASEDNNANMKSYGKWNKYIFVVTVLSSVMAFIMSLGAYLKARVRDGG